MLKIRVPNFCGSEIEYICSVIFGEWLGVGYAIEVFDRYYILISKEDKNIKLNADFFIKASSAWLSSMSMPALPLERYSLKKLYGILNFEIHISETELPVLYGKDYISVSENSIDCGIDILGSIFFMLSRYEEVIVKERDNYNRFLAKSSIAYKEDFLFRPIVNEYLELLFALLKHLFPQIVRSERQFQICPTHDIDIPFAFLHNSNYRIIKGIAGDLLKRRSLALALATYSAWKKFRKFGFQSDLYYCFDFIMNESEKRNLKSAFYFLPSSSPEMLRKYPVTDFEMQSLLQSIDKRGHEIGIHGFYGTYLNGKAFKDDVNLLQNTLDNLGINRKVRGGRQHYLQWQNPETFNVWENAGMKYDSTLSFADMPGFRCGTCYEYSVYDCIKRKKLNLKEKPLIVMECSVIAKRYMNLGLTYKALQVFKRLKDTCKYYDGNFIILFHNTEFITTAQKEFYQKVLDC